MILFIYLFANHNVLDFYPKFGFTSINEYQFTMDFSKIGTVPIGMQKLDGRNDEALSFIYQFASKRIPVSSYFGTDHSVDILMFYCVNVYSQDIYYLEQERVIVIYKQDKNELHLFDVISQSPVDIHDVLVKISNEDTTKIVFHFTPENMRTDKKPFHGGEVLFAKVKDGIEWPKYFKHPVTSQA